MKTPKSRGMVGQLRLILLAMILALPATALAAIDGSKPLLCAVTTVVECDTSGKCERHTADLHPDYPSFIRVNLPQRTITVDGRDERKSEIKSATRLDGRWILHGGENGRGWSAAITEDGGRLSAGVVADTFTFTLFGACTVP
jgi:hypothetical protein